MDIDKTRRVGKQAVSNYQEAEKCRGCGANIWGVASGMLQQWHIVHNEANCLAAENGRLRSRLGTAQRLVDDLKNISPLSWLIEARIADWERAVEGQLPAVVCGQYKPGTNIFCHFDPCHESAHSWDCADEGNEPMKMLIDEDWQRRKLAEPDPEIIEAGYDSPERYQSTAVAEQERCGEICPIGYGKWPCKKPKGHDSDHKNGALVWPRKEPT